MARDSSLLSSLRLPLTGKSWADISTLCRHLVVITLLVGSSSLDAAPFQRSVLGLMDLAVTLGMHGDQIGCFFIPETVISERVVQMNPSWIEDIATFPALEALALHNFIPLIGGLPQPEAISQRVAVARALTRV